MSEKYKGLLALIVGTFIGGAILPSLIRTGVSTINPLVFSFFRTTFSGLIAFLLIYPEWTKFKHHGRSIIKVLLLLGLTLAGNIVLFSVGVSRTTLIVSQLMYTILPITTGVVGLLWLKEKMPTQKIIGALIAMLGVSILIIFSQQAGQQISLGTTSGNLVILGAVCSYTMYMVLSKKYSVKFSPLAMSALSSTGASIVTLPIAAWIISQQTLNQVSFQSWISVIVIGIMSTLFTFLIQYGLKRLSTMTSAVVTQLSPEFAALTGIFIYHEQLSIILLVSLVLVTTGVVLSMQTEKNSWSEKFKLLLNRFTLLKL